MPSNVAVGIELSDEERAQLEAWTRRPIECAGARAALAGCAACGRGPEEHQIAERLGAPRQHGDDVARPGLLSTDSTGCWMSRGRGVRARSPTSRSRRSSCARWRARPRTRRTGRRVRWPARLGSPSQPCCGSGRRLGCNHTARTPGKLSKDPQFIEKVRDVVGLDLNPPERAVVLCVDEKSQIQALDRTAPILPMLPGTPQRATHDYKRAGTSQPLRRVRPHDRQGDRAPALTPPRGRVQAVPGPRSSARSPPGSRSTGARQLLDAQDAGHQTLAGRPPSLRLALHPNQLARG